MIEQARKVCYPYHGHFTSQAQIDLSKEIIKFSPSGMNKTYVVCGGSEAMENAIKFVRQYHLERGESSRTKFVSLWQSYHGSTMACLSLGGRTWSRNDYLPYLTETSHIYFPNCYRCPYNREYPTCEIMCAYELEKIIRLEGENNVAAFFAEPASGATLGAVFPPPEYFPAIREICDKYGILFVADEVVTGFGRTGKNFGIDHWDVVPDIIVSGKGMGSGYTPAGTVILHQKIWDVFSKSTRSSYVMGYTYSFTPVASAAAFSVLQYIIKNKLVERSANIGKYLFEKLLKLKEIPIVGDIRGKGLLLGIELVKDRENKTPFERSLKISETIAEKAFQNGLIIFTGTGTADGVSGDHLVITPPYIINEDEITEAFNILEKIILEVYKENHKR
jgi:adenosylmethionine-8-amino-7-oxononanoate aminotransferase